MVAWSYELLAPVEAEVFEHLAVFHAGWYADAAAAAAHDRHALFFAGLLERASVGLTGPAEPSWAENLGPTTSRGRYGLTPNPAWRSRCCAGR